MTTLRKKNIPGPLADSYCNNLLNELDHFRKSNSNIGNSNSNNGVGNNAWENKVLQSTRIISTIEESEFITNVILNNAKDKNKQVVISLDCEGIDLGINGTATLIGIGTTQGEAFLFDILKCPEMVNFGGLRSLLEDENIIKIIHDCRNDSVSLRKQFRVNINNVFDTQVAHSVIFHQKTPHVKFYRVKLNELLQIYNAPKNPSKGNMKQIYQINPNYWTIRPLTREMVVYAASDVLVIINKQLYNNMASCINQSSLSP